MALVLSVIFSRTSFGSRLNVLGSMSAKTGLALWKRIELAVAMKVNGVVMTSSPSLIPRAFRATSRAAVPLATAIPCLAPKYSANSLSKASTSSPWASIPLLRTSTTAFISSSPMRGLAMGMFLILSPPAVALNLDKLLE